MFLLSFTDLPHSNYIITIFHEYSSFIFISKKWDSTINFILKLLNKFIITQCNGQLCLLFQFFVQNGRNEDQFEVEAPEFDIEDVGAQVR